MREEDPETELLRHAQLIPSISRLQALAWDKHGIWSQGITVGYATYGMGRVHNPGKTLDTRLHDNETESIGPKSSQEALCSFVTGANHTTAKYHDKLFRLLLQ